jgi:hypothetical protein
MIVRAFVGLLFLSGFFMIHIALIFIIGVIMGPGLLRNSGMVGQIIVGSLTLFLLLSFIRAVRVDEEKETEEEFE